MSDRTRDPETFADHVVETVRLQTGGKRLSDTIDETHILIVLAANGEHDHRLVREAGDVAVEQGHLRKTDEGYMVAEGNGGSTAE